MQHLDDDQLEAAASRVPPEWYEGRTEELSALLEELAERRSKLPELILACRRSEKQPFPNWKDGARAYETV